MAGPTLEQVIRNANPYIQLPGDPRYENPIVIEQQLDVGHWNFKDVSHFIEKAIRIPYTYTDDNGVLIRDYLLIGYEGGGAY